MKSIKEVVEHLCENVCGVYKITDSNGKDYNLIFNEQNIPHVLGLHKVSDIPKLQSLNNIKNKKTDRIIKDIKLGGINNEIIASSSNSEGIKEVESRVDNSYMISAMISQGEMIADFDPQKVMFKDSIIDAASLIYKLDNGTSYHLFLKKQYKDNYYPVTFFVRQDDNYYKKQNSYKIVNVTRNNGSKKKKSKKKKKVLK